MNEKFKFAESLSMPDGRIIVPQHSSGRLVGEVETTVYDQAGRVLFKRKDLNDVILPGSVFVLEQMFKTKAADRRLHPTSVNTGTDYFGTINLTSRWNEPTDVKDEYVFGFMAGNGGASATGANAIKYNRTCLSDGIGNASFIPFRIIPSNITQPTDYAFHVLASGSYLYYIKKFTEEPTIVVSDDATYAQMKLSVTAEEFREYFAQTGVTASPGINQIGLVAGMLNSATGNFDDIKLITTLNFATIDLAEETHFDMIYKVYCL